MQNLVLKLDGSLEFLVKASLSVPLTILLIPTSLIVFLLSFLYIHWIYRLAKYFGNPELCEPLHMNSAALAGFDYPFKVIPTLVILPMLVVEGVPDINKIRRMIRQKVLKKKDEKGNSFYPELLWSLEYFMGYPFWKRIPGMTEERVLENNVGVYKKIGGWDPVSLLDFAKAFAVKQFKKGEPLWELAILENYHPESGNREPHFAVVLRFHHCLTDAVGGLSVLRDLGNQSKGIDLNLSRGYHVYKILSPGYRGVYDVLTYIMNGVAYASEQSVWPSNNAAVSETRGQSGSQFSAAFSFSLDTRCATLTNVRKVSKTWGVSCTTVILTAILRVIRSTLFQGQSLFPSYVVVMIPLASPEHSGKLRNSAFLVNTLLPLYVEDPVVHAREVDKEFQSVKNSSIPHMADAVGKLGALIPGPLWDQLLEYTPNKSEAVAFSTTVGPKDFPYFCGYKMKEVSYLLPLADGNSKFPFFQMVSMADKLYLSVTADKSLIESDAMAGRIVNGFHDEIANFAQFRYRETCIS